MWLQILSYLCLLVFVAGLSWRVIRYSSLPVHLRWELYPVAHEKSRPYGGSYLEDIDWWHRPIRTNPLGEFTVFMGEILFFKEYFKSKRGFWYFVYPFHIGLFLILAWVVLLLIGAFIQIGGAEVSATSTNIWIAIVYYLTLIAGVAAFVTGIFGNIGLLIKRLTDNDMKNYTDPIDYFNLACILAIFSLGFLTWIVEDPAFNMARGYISGLIQFKSGELGILGTAFVLLSLLFLAYMPFTRMMHYVAKYFTYHKVRWDDRPNFRGSQLEGKIRKMLSWRGTWAAHHIKPGMTWEQQVKDSGTSEEKK